MTIVAAFEVFTVLRALMQEPAVSEAHRLPRVVLHAAELGEHEGRDLKDGDGGGAPVRDLRAAGPDEVGRQILHERERVAGQGGGTYGSGQLGPLGVEEAQGIQVVEKADRRSFGGHDEVLMAVEDVAASEQAPVIEVIHPALQIREFSGGGVGVNQLVKHHKSRAVRVDRVLKKQHLELLFLLFGRGFGRGLLARGGQTGLPSSEGFDERDGFVGSPAGRSGRADVGRPMTGSDLRDAPIAHRLLGDQGMDHRSAFA